jgi:hypothetical protein
MDNWFAITTYTLIMAWMVAIFVGVFSYVRHGPQWNQTASQKKFRCFLQVLFLGSALSIINVAQRLNDQGLIPDSLKWFLSIMTLVMTVIWAHGLSKAYKKNDRADKKAQTEN